MSILGNNLLAEYYAQNNLPYKRRVGYIQTNGTQYYDLMHKFSGLNGVELDVMLLNSPTRLYGDRHDFINYGFGINRISESERIGVYYFSSGPIYDSQSGIDPIGNRCKIIVMNGFLKIKYEQNEYAYDLKLVSRETNSNVCLMGFYVNDSISCSVARLYSCREYDSQGNLRHDYIPVLDYNNDACLYDGVTKNLLYHINTTGNTKPTYGD